MSILEEAQAVIYGDREQTYGDPGKNIRMIADLWAVWLGHSVSVEDVCEMMILVKLARLKNTPNHHDSQLDVCGYQALLERIQDATATLSAQSAGRKSRIECIQEINGSAAQWLMEYYPDSIGNPDIKLTGMFRWKSSPQGDKFWSHIGEELWNKYGYR